MRAGLTNPVAHQVISETVVKEKTRVQNGTPYSLVKVLGSAIGQLVSTSFLTVSQRAALIWAFLVSLQAFPVITWSGVGIAGLRVASRSRRPGLATVVPVLGGVLILVSTTSVQVQTVGFFCFHSRRFYWSAVTTVALY